MDLLESGVAVAEAARVLADRFGCSARQARRYLERAARGGPAAVPEQTTVFTVKLPAALVARVREQARESGSTISALVTRAVTEFLARGHRSPRRR
jgi:Ribbon-helix-helix protein, copG family